MLVNGEKVSSKNVKRTLDISKNKKERSLNVSNCKKARYLVDKFLAHGDDDAANCYNYFVICFSKLSEKTIWDIYENATNNPSVKSAIRYFIAACRNQMAGTVK
jgi:hypothetical protein